MTIEIGRLAAAVGLRPVRYRGRLVAAASAQRVYLAPDIARLEPGDPRLRFAAALCLYARDVETGAVPAPYDDAAAEFYARCILIADDDFARRQHEPDTNLAERFRVPLEQIAAKRLDLPAEPQEGPTRR